MRHFWPSFSLCRFPVEFYSTTKSDLGTVSLKRFFTLISNYFWATPVWVSSTISVLRFSEIWIFAGGRVDDFIEFVSIDDVKNQYFVWVCPHILARLFGTEYTSAINICTSKALKMILSHRSSANFLRKLMRYMENNNNNNNKKIWRKCHERCVLNNKSTTYKKHNAASRVTSSTRVAIQLSDVYEYI